MKVVLVTKTLRAPALIRVNFNNDKLNPKLLL